MQALKWVFVIALVATAAFFVKRNLEERALIGEQNEATDLYNARKYEEAARAFEKLMGKLPGERRANLRRQLALCYKNLATLEKPLDEQARWMKKALEADPEVPLDAMERKIAEKGGQPASATGP